MLHITVDNREPDEIITGIENLAKTHKIDVVRQNLEHADIHIGNDENRSLIVFERKTIADLLASVNDGRYAIQKAALLEAFDRKSIFYIIETSNGIFSSENEKAIGCIISMMLRDDIKICFTKNTKETVDLIEHICKRLIKNFDKYFNSQPETSTSPVCIVKRKAAPSSGDVFTNMLMQIPGFSAKSAKAIVSSYPTLIELQKAMLDSGGTDQFRNSLLVNGRRLPKPSVEALFSIVHPK